MIKRKKDQVHLPTKLKEPAGDFDDYSVLVTGEKKIGKTSLAIQEPQTLLLQCDPPQRAYRRMETVLHNWRESRDALKQLTERARADRFPWRRICLDGADTWYQMCLVQTCLDRGIEYPEDEEWGRGWNALRQEFTKAVNQLLRLPCGVWFLCHAVWQEVKGEDGKKFDRLSPRLPGMAEEILNGRVDIWIAYDYHHRDRVLILQGSQRYGAGHRLDEHFRSRRTGEPLRSIKAGTSAAEAHANLLAAFHNEYRLIKEK